MFGSTLLLSRTEADTAEQTQELVTLFTDVSDVTGQAVASRAASDGFMVRIGLPTGWMVCSSESVPDPLCRRIGPCMKSLHEPLPAG